MYLAVVVKNRCKAGVYRRHSVSISRKTFMWSLVCQWWHWWPTILTFVSPRCSRNTDTVILALHVSIAVCSAGRQLQGYRWGRWYTGPVVPNLDTPGHDPVSSTDPRPCPSPINYVQRIMGSFAQPFSPHTVAIGLWLEGARTAWALLHSVCMLTLSPGFKRQPPFFFVTAIAPALDVMSSPGAMVAQVFSALETGQIQALTGLVCGERLSPDAALTPLPSCMLFTFRCWHLFKEGRKKKNRGVCFYPS